MKLVEIDGVYINTDRVDVLLPHEMGEECEITRVLIGGTHVFIHKPLNEVVRILQEGKGRR